MGFTLDKKRSVISILIFISYLISSIGIRMYLWKNTSSFTENYNVYMIISFLISLPLIFLTIYVLYSLRDRLVFKIILLIHIIQLFIPIVGVLLGYFDSHIAYSTVLILISNIKIVIYIALITIAFIQKERVLTLVYLFISLMMIFLSSMSSLISRIISVVNDQNQIIMIINSLNFSQMLLQLSMTIVLILLFYKYGEFNNNNKMEKENELIIENY